ncbi:MAG: penicillin-binding protein 2 [Aminivibrio sp.]|jgi:penicillin-binding protein 2
MSDLRALHNSRLRLMRFAVILSLALLALGLYYFQVIHSDTYVRLASNNRLRLIRFPPVRGEIYDRNGALLAVNVTTFDIMGYPLDIERAGMVEKLAGLLSNHGLPYTEEDLARSIKRQFWAPYRVVRLVSNITLAQMADLVADPEFPRELFPLPVWRRIYPAGSLASNVTGYVGEISEGELKQLGGENYAAGDLIGKNGIERQYEELLRGFPGEESVEVDARGRKVRTIDVRPAGRGQDLHLTLDLGAQRLAADLMKGHRGAIAVMDANTGEVLVLYSSPSYDNNPLAWGVSTREWSALINDPEKPMHDRSISGVYPPASTFKALVALAALEEKEVVPRTSVVCTGAFTLGNRTFRCWKRSGHGRVNLLTALQDSCDVYFYQAGLKLGITKLLKWCSLFGLGAPTGIDLPGEAGGTVGGPDWKKARLKETWYHGDTVNYSIGQGFLLTTPLQIARLYAAVANGGRLVRPRLLYAGEEDDPVLPVSKENLNQIKKGLDYVVKRGTGRRAGSYGISVAGKTGTAQNAHGPDHALFAGYAPADSPRYVAVAVIEAGLHGSSVASPMVGEILSYLLVPEARSKAQ